MRPQTGVLIATILGSSMVFIDGSVVNVILPVLQNAFHVDALQIQWVVDAYLLFLSSLMLIGGSLGDRFGRKRIFIGGILLFCASSVGVAFSQTLTVITVFRAIQGVGGALLTPTSLALINDSFGKKERAKAIGTWSGFSILTSAIGPLAGGLLSDRASWRWVFLINVFFGALTLFVVWRFIPDDRKKKANTPIDYPGVVLSTLAIGAMIDGLIQQQTIVTVSGLTLLVLFLFVESRVKNPMVPLSLFRERLFWSINLVTFIIYGGLSIAFYFLPFNLIQVRGFTATEAGAASLPFVVIIFVFARWTGTLYDKFGARLPIAVGSSLVATGFALIAVLSKTAAGYWSGFFPGLVVFGFGMALVVSPLTTAVMASVPEGDSGLASGINNSVTRIAGLMGTAIMTLVMVTFYQSQIASIQMNGDEKNSVLQRVKELGDMHGFSQDIKQQLNVAYAHAYSSLMLVTAGLVLIGSLAAIICLPKMPEKVNSRA